jgi:sirohydrochlorin ferrochelatase
MSSTVFAASHGTSSAEGRTAVRMLVQKVAESLTITVVACHVDVEQPDVATAIASSVSFTDRAVIVPLLLSAGYHVHVDLAACAAEAPVPAVVAAALGPDPRLVTVLVDRLREAGYRAGDSVVLAAAGSSDARAVDDCLGMARMLAERLNAPVNAGFLSAAQPSLSDAVAAVREANPAARVVIACYLLAPGYFADLTREAGADVVAAPLLTPDSTPPELVRIVNDRVAAVVDRAEPEETPAHGIQS